jgi:hypothetical protein
MMNQAEKLDFMSKETLMVMHVTWTTLGASPQSAAQHSNRLCAARRLRSALECKG